MDTVNTNTPDVMTAAQMTSMLRDDGTRVRDAGRALEAAERVYASVTHRSRYATDEAHTASFKEYIGPLAKAEQSAIGAAFAAERNARAVLAQTAGATITLSAPNMAEAATRQPLIATDVERYSLQRLADDVRAAIVRDDHPAMFLFARLVPERLAQPQERDAKERQREAASALTTMLLQIGEILRDTRFDALRQQALDAIGAADTLRSRASKRERAARPLLTHDGRPMVRWADARR